jgi:hypothetical protein
MQFYVLRPVGDRRFGTRCAYADVLDPHNVGSNTENGVCPVCGGGLGMLPWLPPHRIALSSARYPDFLWGAGFDLMVSARFRDLYVDAGLTGITQIDPPAEIVRVGRKPIAQADQRLPDYHNVRYVRGGADLDDERSDARRLLVRCERCRPSITAVQRVVLKAGSWNGFDVFEAFGLPGHILVSERFKALVDEHGLTNAALTAAEEYRLDPEERRARLARAAAAGTIH